MALTCLQSAVAVSFSYISRDFWTALNTKNPELFFHQAELFFGALVAFTPVVVFYQYYRDKASLQWREWITQRIIEQYTTGRNYYFLDEQTGVDNPDQRIAQDLNAFTTESINLILTLLVSAIDVVCFSTILFSIYPILFGILVLYAASGTVLTTLLGKRLITLNYNQLVREADFRYSLVRLRDNAESIAFFGGEARERAEIGRRFSLALDNMMDVIQLRRQVAFLQTGYKYAVQVLPALCVAPKYFAGQIELGVVTQSFGAFSHILSDLSLVVNRFDSLSQFGAGIDRLAQFVVALEQSVDEETRTFNAGDGKRKEGDIQIVPSDGATVAVKDLTIEIPGGGKPRRLLENLSFKLEAGQRLLVAGPSGTGKSSLMRVLAGLWSEGSGQVMIPQSGVMFLPQKVYCSLGSLRENLIYPKDDCKFSDERLIEVLEAVDLGELAQRDGGLDAVADWTDVLSVGEQQRLQFGRLMLSDAKVVVIDEGTSALSVKMERQMYEMVQKMGVTVISVGHRPSLLAYHDKLLRLGDEWTMDEIKEEVQRREVNTL